MKDVLETQKGLDIPTNLQYSREIEKSMDIRKLTVFLKKEIRLLSNLDQEYSLTEYLEKFKLRLNTLRLKT